MPSHARRATNSCWATAWKCSLLQSIFINVPGGEEAAREGLSIFTNEIDDKWGLGMAYLNMARLAAAKGDQSEKQKYYGKLKELLRDMPASFLVGMFFLGMGMDESIRGNYGTAKRLFEDGLDIFRLVRNRNFQIVVMSELGHIARHTGDIRQARRKSTRKRSRAGRIWATAPQSLINWNALHLSPLRRKNPNTRSSFLARRKLCAKRSAHK